MWLEETRMRFSYVGSPNNHFVNTVFWDNDAKLQYAGSLTGKQKATCLLKFVCLFSFNGKQKQYKHIYNVAR